MDFTFVIEADAELTGLRGGRFVISALNPAFIGTTSALAIRISAQGAVSGIGLG